MADEGLVELTIQTIATDASSGNPVMILTDREKARYLPIWIGKFEAEAIVSELEGKATPRPMTHVLFRRTIEAIGGKVLRAVITDLQEQTYFAQVVLAVDGREQVMDARPSDAVALAMGFKAPLFATLEVMKRCAIHNDNARVVAEAADRPKVDVVRFGYAEPAPWPDYREVREPVAALQAPAVLGIPLAGEANPRVWAITGSNWALFRADVTESIGGRAGPAIRLPYDLKRFQWPMVMLRLDPSQTWSAARLCFDLHGPDDTRFGAPIECEVVVAGARGQYHAHVPAPIAPGWTAITLDLMRPDWSFKREGGRVKHADDRDGVAADLAVIGPLNLVTVMLNGWERAEAGTLYLSNLRIE